MARRQGAGRARRSGRDREARPVELVQQRLPVDIETGEGDEMGQAVHRVADHLHVRDQLRHPLPDPVHQPPQPRRFVPGLRPRPQRAQGRRGGHDRRDVLEPRRAARLPLVVRPLRREPGALADREQPDAGRAAPLVGARRQQRPGAGHRPPRQRLRGIHQEGHARLPAERGHLFDRLFGSHLVVGGLEADQRGVRAERGADLVGRHPARTVHRQLRRRVPPAASWTSAACRTAECSTAECSSRRPTRRRAASAPETPACTACVPEGVKTNSSGRQPTASAAASRAASSSSRARRPSR